MAEYLITSEFAQGDRVCLVGDCTNGDYFGVVVGHSIQKHNQVVLVSFAGEIASFYEEQLESQEQRKVDLMIQGVD
jgi:hypothetical protein